MYNAVEAKDQPRQERIISVVRARQAEVGHDLHHCWERGDSTSRGDAGDMGHVGDGGKWRRHYIDAGDMEHAVLNLARRIADKLMDDGIEGDGVMRGVWRLARFFNREGLQKHLHGLVTGAAEPLAQHAAKIFDFIRQSGGEVTQMLKKYGAGGRGGKGTTSEEL